MSQVRVKVLRVGGGPSRGRVVVVVVVVIRARAEVETVVGAMPGAAKGGGDNTTPEYRTEAQYWRRG